MSRSPPSLSGVPCRIVAMAGKWFPTGCHKVGASFGCLAPRLVTGQFDATYHHAVWPSTGNYCRGGAFNCKLLACDSVAILPAEMSKERFEWLSKIAGQVIATPGCESNVKEIFDKTWELKQDPAMMIFNQFEEMGNPLWHYNVTGYALCRRVRGDQEARPALRGRVLHLRLRRHDERGRPAQGALSRPEARRRRGAAVPDHSRQRLRRPPHRGHRRQAHPVDPQRQEHRHGHRHRRRGQPAPAAPVQHTRGPEVPQGRAGS